MKLFLPYGQSAQQIDIDNADVLVSDIDHLNSGKEPDMLVREAMENSVGGAALEELAKGKKTAVIIISDHTRPVPSKHIIPFMLSALRRENPKIEITLLVATGLHRGTLPGELTEKLGKEIAENEHIVVHDCRDQDNHILIGILPSGAELWVNKLAIETDLLIAEGFIEPHFFAGFSGGRKSILPGICAEATVLGNHCSKFIANECAKTGVLENNPIHTDMLAAARMAKLAYIVNVIIDENKRILAAFAGDPIFAHNMGCDVLKKYCCVTPVQKGDIVITTNGGYPLDQNVYQAVKGLSTAQAVAAPGAVLVVCAQCIDGIGGERFYAALKECVTPDELLTETIKRPMEDTLPDQWQYQILADILSKHRVIFVTEP